MNRNNNKDAIKTLIADCIVFSLYIVFELTIFIKNLFKVKNNMKLLWNWTVGLTVAFIFTIILGVPINNCIKGGGDHCNPTHYWKQQIDKHYG